MGSVEDKVRDDINTKFGSIPKMAKSTGIAQNTIYHALERGLDNTTSKTKQQIFEALYGEEKQLNYAVISLTSDLSSEEQELVKLFRQLPTRGRHAVLAGLRDFTRKQ